MAKETIHQTMHQKMEHLEKENMLLKEQLKQTQGYLDEERKLSSKLADMYDDDFKKSEIPCRVSSDLHEWCNDLDAVSTVSSVKL